MTNLREELLIKEREIYDCKNELGLLNSKISRESDLRRSAEDTMKRNENKYDVDAQKFSTNLRNQCDQNENLSTKLSEAERNFYRISAEKKETEEMLSNKVTDLSSYKDRLLSENEEKGRYLLNLQRDNQELKDNLSNESVKRSVGDGKNAELTQSYDRLFEDKRLLEDQFKRENSNLFERNTNLERIISDNRNEINSLNSNLESLKFNTDARNNKQESEIFALNKNNEELRDHKANLDSQLSDQTGKRFRTEQLMEDNKQQADHTVRNLQSNIDKNNYDIQSLQTRLNSTAEAYNETYRDNEKILREYDEYKQKHMELMANKDGEISELNYRNNNLRNDLEKTQSDLKETQVSLKLS